jgi:hypothetical protein
MFTAIYYSLQFNFHAAIIFHLCFCPFQRSHRSLVVLFWFFKIFREKKTICHIVNYMYGFLIIS